MPPRLRECCRWLRIYSPPPSRFPPFVQFANGFCIFRRSLWIRVIRRARLVSLSPKKVTRLWCSILRKWSHPSQFIRARLKTGQSKIARAKYIHSIYTRFTSWWSEVEAQEMGGTYSTGYSKHPSVERFWRVSPTGLADGLPGP